MSFFNIPYPGGLSVPRTSGHTRNADLTSLHQEIDDFRMEQSGFSGQQSAKQFVIMRFFLNAERSMLIELIRKWYFRMTTN
jgi:hypothetical protein